ncbi:hypothetical protein AB0I52_06310 [Streptomyces sp. NPDC050423]|uniref:hypothetical protein n=1 Tax=Streptomyces sp. NPDC050423 TaxID=3155402 RepID=UPI00341552A1
MSRLVLLDRVPLQAEAADEVVHGVDLRDASAVEAALAGADAVLHLGDESRHLATWLSPRDAVGFCRAALTAPLSTRFATAYAASADTRRFWELPAESELAYTPIDDAETYASLIADADVPADPEAPQAGPYALPEFTLRHLRP